MYSPLNLHLDIGLIDNWPSYTASGRGMPSQFMRHDINSLGYGASPAIPSQVAVFNACDIAA